MTVITAQTILIPAFGRMSPSSMYLIWNALAPLALPAFFLSTYEATQTSSLLTVTVTVTTDC